MIVICKGTVNKKSNKNILKLGLRFDWIKQNIISCTRMNNSTVIIPSTTTTPKYLTYDIEELNTYNAVGTDQICINSPLTNTPIIFNMVHTYL